MSGSGTIDAFAVQTGIKANRVAKDSVFRDLFSRKEYLLQLYRALHPEDGGVSEEDLEYVTLDHVLVHDIYNDLGFLIGDRLLILVEAQSTWTVNIIVRCLMYMAVTYQGYLKKSRQSLFSVKPVRIPKPELYVIYSGGRDIGSKYISLSEKFFDGEETALDVRVRVITDGNEGDIINQYIVFTRVMDEQVRIYGRTRRAVVEAIRICRGRDVLSEYLKSRETEVADMMITLFDQDEIWEDYAASIRREEEEKAAEAVEKTAKNTSKKLYDTQHMSPEIIAEIVGYSVDTVKGWLGLTPQLQK